jgi:hypothetical protein
MAPATEDDGRGFLFFCPQMNPTAVGCHARAFLEGRPKNEAEEMECVPKR